MRLGGQLKGGYYPTPPRVVDHVRSLLFAPVRYGRNRDQIVRGCSTPAAARATRSGSWRTR